MAMKCSILHFEMDKTIKFERIFFSLEPFLKSLPEIHVNTTVLGAETFIFTFQSQTS